MRTNLKTAYEASDTAWEALRDDLQLSNNVQSIVLMGLIKRAADLANDIKTLLAAVKGDAQ